MQKWMAPLERAGKTDQKMLWFDMIRLKVLEIFNVETTFILLFHHFSHFLCIFNPSYLEMFSSDHIEPYHF